MVAMRLVVLSLELAEPVSGNGVYARSVVRGLHLQGAQVTVISGIAAANVDKAPDAAAVHAEQLLCIPLPVTGR